jgi:hypothetical protein
MSKPARRIDEILFPKSALKIGDSTFGPLRVGESVGCEHASELAKTTLLIFACIQVSVDHIRIVLE